MDKQEYKLKAEEIKALISKREFQKAVKIADEIDWTRVRSVAMLCTVSDLYKVNRRYKESKELLLMAYERHPGGRMILYSLCELCIKMGEVVQAIEYYKEFVQLAPMDNGKFVLQYKLYEAQEVSLEERIAVLEELKKRDYREKWGYELAYLYHRIGLATKCVEECDQLILWFSEGRYVKKAMELKMLHQPLSSVQQASYEHLIGGKKETLPPQKQPAKEVVKPPEELDIQVKPMKMGKYDTINLQKALAESMKEVLSNEESTPVQAAVHQEPVTEPGLGPVTSQIMAPMYDTGTNLQEVFFTDNTEEMAQELKPAEVSVPEKELKKNTPATEVDIDKPPFQEASQEASNEQIVPKVVKEVPLEPKIQEISRDRVREAQEPVRTGGTTEEVTKEIPSIKEIMKRPLVQPVQEEIPAQMAKLLTQDYDGQISLVVPEEARVEKQITGQMNIDEVLVEWEKTKKEYEEKRKAKLTQKVLAQTGRMFSDFDAKVRDGILEQLEKEEAQQEKGVLRQDADGRSELPEMEELTERKILPDEEELPEVEELAEIEEPVTDLEELVQSAEEETEEIRAGLTGEEISDEEAEEKGIAKNAADTRQNEKPSMTERGDTREETLEEKTLEEKTLEEKTLEEETLGEEVPGEEISREDGQEVIRELTEEERSLFGPFIQTKGGRKRFMKALDLISLAAYTGNVIISGEAASGTVTLAKNIMKDIQMTDANFSGVIAKVSGASLNSRNIDSTISKLNNGGLIIEKASGMNSQAVMKLLKALNQEQSGIVVILEDNKKAIRRMLAAYPSIAPFFNARIEIEELNNDALAAYGRQYAQHLEYAIDELGMLALQTRIEDRQTSDHIVTVAEVRELVDEAIANANRKNLQHFFDLILGKRYDEEDMVILREKDFM